MALTGYQNFESANAAILDEVHRTFTGYMFGGSVNPRWSQSLGLFSPLPTRGNQAKAKMATRSVGVHEWKDEREYQGITHVDHTVEVRRWANGLELRMDDLEDEAMNLGQYRELIAGMPDDFEAQKHRLLIKMLTDGDSSTQFGLCYDGNEFFDASHVVADNGDGVTTVSNLTTDILDSDALDTAFLTMRKMRTPDGELAEVVPTHIIAPEALRATIEVLIDQPTLAAAGGGATNNKWYKKLIPIYDPRLDLESTAEWYLWDSTYRLKPFFLAERQALTPQMALDDWNRKIKWGAWCRYNYGYGFYQSILKSTGAS